MGKFEEKIQPDRLCSQKAKAEDIQIFLHKKEDRKMNITTGVDKEFEKSAKNRQDWWRRMKNMKIAEVEKSEPDEVKKKMLEKLVKCDVPDQFHMGKPKLPVISQINRAY